MYDIAIIGGGINGAGIARDAAGRGLKVVLLEQGDLASATSSASTKLVHGGLRYLEHYDFRLVRESLMEREVLARIAPHNVRALRFVLPHHRGLRPRWMLHAGLVLYDLLGNRSFRRAAPIDLRADPAGAPLQARYRHGFSYADCWTDDARLVVLNAIDAAERGADIRVRAPVTMLARAGAWRIGLAGGEIVQARALVNAAGAWVNDVLAMAGVKPKAAVRLVQGSHIVVPKLHEGDHAYVFQQADGRVVFAIPFEGDFTLIGTTDRDYSGDPGQVRITPEERAYLCAAASEYFRQPIAEDRIVWTYSGVRALYDDGASRAQEVTRDYVFALDAEGPPILSIYGGKITTYRRLAEGALASLASHLPMRKRWTAEAPLPGGGFADFGAQAAALREAAPFLSQDSAVRLTRAYGDRAVAMFAGAAELGETFGADLSAREVDYLIAREWARSAEDILWRRTKLGLRATSQDAARLDSYVQSKLMRSRPGAAIGGTPGP